MLGFEIPAIGLVLHFVGAIWATGRAIKYTEGPALPLWLALIWLVACLGPILALLAIKKERTPPA